MAGVRSFDLKRAIQGYRFDNKESKNGDSSPPETEELLGKLDAVVSVLEAVRDSIKSGKLDIDCHLAAIHKLTDEISRYEVREAELKRLVDHIVERTQVELIKLIRHPSSGG